MDHNQFMGLAFVAGFVVFWGAVFAGIGCWLWSVL
jgi:hypothetical protein